MCIYFLQEEEFVASLHYNCNTLPCGVSFEFNLTFNILNLTIFPWNIHRGKLLSKNKAINLPSKAQWGNSCLLSTPTTTKLYFYFLTLCCFAKNSHLLLHASLPDKPAMPSTQTPSKLLSFLPSTPSIPVPQRHVPWGWCPTKGTASCNSLHSQRWKTCRLQLELHHAGVGFVYPLVQVWHLRSP